MTLEIVRTGDIEFEFVGAHGVPTKGKSVGVSILEGGGPIWWIVSDEYSETWAAADGRELRGFEADTELVRWQQLKDGANGRFLSCITYGEVPEGFNQVTPDDGPPPPLCRGVRYVVHFLGSEIGMLEFEF